MAMADSTQCSSQMKFVYWCVAQKVFSVAQNLALTYSLDVQRPLWPLVVEVKQMSPVAVLTKNEIFNM